MERKSGNPYPPTKPSSRAVVKGRNARAKDPAEEPEHQLQSALKTYLRPPRDPSLRAALHAFLALDDDFIGGRVLKKKHHNDAEPDEQISDYEAIPLRTVVQSKTHSSI